MTSRARANSLCLVLPKTSRTSVKDRRAKINNSMVYAGMTTTARRLFMSIIGRHTIVLAMAPVTNAVRVYLDIFSRRAASLLELDVIVGTDCLDVFGFSIF